MTIGDLISYRSEHGIVVHENDAYIVMRTTGFHSYVPVLNVQECMLVKGTLVPSDECVIKPDLLWRIEKYVNTVVNERPTGS